MALSSDNPWLQAWYGGRRWTWLLLPLMWLFRVFSALRRVWLTGVTQQRLPVPVIVVGNIAVGGTGKTPLLLALLARCQAAGFKPGVVSRGYGGRADTYPLLVNAHTPVEQTGDEPWLIWQQSGCPVSVGPDRPACARLLVDMGCDIILSDDGLQHYRLGRDMEIAVVDAARAFGNGQCLPVGPLREPLSRLDTVDIIAVNGTVSLPVSLPRPPFHFILVPRHWQRLSDDGVLPLASLPPGTRVHAVAGIGNPQRFYQTLRELRLDPVEHDFPDHHAYDARDLAFDEPLPVVMTAKDAVKCRVFARENTFSLVVEAQPGPDFWSAFDQQLAQWR